MDALAGYLWHKTAGVYVEVDQADLDVVRLEGEDSEEVSVHPGGLEGPAGALLVKQGPEYGEGQHHEGHVVDSRQVKLSVSSFQLISVFLYRGRGLFRGVASCYSSNAIKNQ